ncbi:MAG: D-amino acid dehydrogenase [Burkholderiales bacterium]
MKILVLGAGVIGVTSAWYLTKAGHQVTVIERQPGAGMETSFANGGQISVSHAEPWANPGAPLKILKWLGHEDAPLLFRLRADWRQWSWGLRFLLECLPGRTRQNTLTILRLALYSRQALQALRREIGISYDHLERGILHIHTDAREFEASHERVALMRAHGCAMRIVSAIECVGIEPALANSRVGVIGGTYEPSDESGDAHLFTRALAGRAAEAGAVFRYETAVESLQVHGSEVKSVSVRGPDGQAEGIETDAVVVAMGSYAPLLLEKVGVRVPVYPVKGYSVTILLDQPEAAPTVCLTDENAKIAMSRLGNRLRAAGTAELNGYDTSLNDIRCNAILARVKNLFPSAAPYNEATRWTGLRPATPSNVPLIGRARYRNLYLNTGHGTLGWTLACGSGRALADLIGGRAPEVEFPFL